MKKKWHDSDVALAMGVCMGGLHALWALAVAVGVAQWYLDFILGLHFLNNPYVIQPFSLANALGLVVVTFVVGYVLGWVGSWLCRMVIRK